ncbi:hypothetical protein AHAS_Ahas03G0114300 [Arachis hypogaea]
MVQYRPDNARGEGRFRHYRRVLNGIGMLAVEWTPYTDPQLEGLISHAIAKADHTTTVVDRVVWQFGGLQHIPTRPLDIDSMHRMDGQFGWGEWFPHLLWRWHELWDHRADHCLHIYHHIDLSPLLPYITWYLQWAHTELFSQELQQPEDGHLPELRHPARRGRGRGWGRVRGRGRHGGGGGKEQGDELHQDRDPVSPPGYGPEGVGGHEAGSQTVGTLLGPLPGGYLSLRPPGSHHSDASSSHHVEGLEVGTSQQEQRAVHGDIVPSFI